ncbi:MAG TPA: 3-oxoacyl-[acyl-carrier-protein] reductase [Candidatus Kapabacteria bacterium]|nr:3-oxoacyl-[acyl-carrier-protein] reductase [Candidatus Kapabacteria bacterium]
MSTLADKIALVTGGSRGIGKAIVKRLAADGATVGFTFNANADAAAQTVEEIRSAGGNVKAYRCDNADAGSIEAAVHAVITDLGGLDILVNNAGITRDGLIARMSEADWDAVIDTNLKGTFLFSKAAIKHMMSKRQGRIINIASVVGITGNAGQANYVSSKAGVIGLTKSIAKELAGRSITANAIAPGYITTDMTAKLNDAQQAAIAGMIPMKRQGTPEEVAAAVAFLAGPDSVYITGQVLCVDGGMVM